MDGITLSEEWTGAAIPRWIAIVEERAGRVCLQEEALAVAALAHVPAAVLHVPAAAAAPAAGGGRKMSLVRGALRNLKVAATSHLHCGFNGQV